MNKPKNARVFHAEMWGTREGKYRALAESDVSSTEWTELEPQGAFYLFTPQDRTYAEEYDEGWGLRDVFPENSVGMVTARDALTVHFEQAHLLDTVRNFASIPEDEARAKYNLGRDARDWKVSYAQTDLRSAPITADRVATVLYRPFDVRFTYYTGQSRGFIGQPQQRVMRQMLETPNVGLSTTRSVEIGDWEHIFCTATIIQHHTVSLKEVNYLFPLYLYPTGEPATDLFDAAPVAGRRANLAPEFIADFAARLGMEWVPDGKGDRVATFGPEDVFHYLYAVFHSPAYRERYAEFLRIDFPRLPLTTDAELFRALCEPGRELVALHLMEAHPPLVTRYTVAGDNTVERVRRTEPGQGGEEGRVWINPTQFFDGVPLEVWTFRVGGYQVAEKWLKDRKGRALTFDDLLHYQRIVAALARTRALMAEIDAAIEARGGWPLAGAAAAVG